MTKALVRGPTTGDCDVPLQHVGPTNAGGAFRRFLEIWRPPLAEAEGDLSLATVRAWFCREIRDKNCHGKCAEAKLHLPCQLPGRRFRGTLQQGFVTWRRTPQDEKAQYEQQVLNASSQSWGLRAKGVRTLWLKTLSAQILNSEC